MKITWSTRLVILTKTKAFKIPVDRRGWLQGKNEKTLWDQYKDSNLLAPLIWEFFGITCQTRIKPISEIDLDRVSQIKSYIPRFQFENCDLYNKANWGWYGGKPVLLDYGIDEEISKMY